MVNLAKEYVKHDAYTLKVIAESSEELKAKYGENFEESERFTSRRNFMIRNILLALIVAINLYFIIYFLRDLFKTNKISKKNLGICVCCPSRHLSPSFFQHLAFPTLLSEPSFIQS